MLVVQCSYFCSINRLNDGRVQVSSISILVFDNIFLYVCDCNQKEVHVSVPGHMSYFFNFSRFLFSCFSEVVDDLITQLHPPFSFNLLACIYFL